MLKNINKIFVKFIGRNKSIGLIKERIYAATIYTENNYIYVDWGINRCPYDSLEKLKENWEIRNERRK